MTAIELSSYAGLTAMTLLTLNILIGLVMSVKYNPVRNWPHRRINTFKIHNWTGYIALAVAIFHPLIILFSSTAKFRLIDIIYPVNAPRQPWINVFGAIALYSLCFVVVTSYFRLELGRKSWKKLHFTAYATALCFYIPRNSHRPQAQGQSKVHRPKKREAGGGRREARRARRKMSPATFQQG